MIAHLKQRLAWYPKNIWPTAVIILTIYLLYAFGVGFVLDGIGTPVQNNIIELGEQLSQRTQTSNQIFAELDVVISPTGAQTLIWLIILLITTYIVTAVTQSLLAILLIYAHKLQKNINIKNILKKSAKTAAILLIAIVAVRIVNLIVQLLLIPQRLTSGTHPIQDIISLLGTALLIAVFFFGVRSITQTPTKHKQKNKWYKHPLTLTTIALFVWLIVTNYLIIFASPLLPATLTIIITATLILLTFAVCAIEISRPTHKHH